MKLFLYFALLLLCSIFSGCDDSNEIQIYIKDKAKVRITVVDSNIVRVTSIPYGEKFFPRQTVAISSAQKRRVTSISKKDSEEFTIIKPPPYRFSYLKKTVASHSWIRKEGVSCRNIPQDANSAQSL